MLLLFFCLVMGPVDKSQSSVQNEDQDDIEEEQLCVKLHRLGRTCFRKVECMLLIYTH